MQLTPANLTHLCRLLLGTHGEVKEWMGDFPLAALTSDPLDQLIATILSQATSDRHSSRAYANLRRAFPSWAEVTIAPAEELAEIIGCAGLGRQKARAIKSVLARLERDRGSLGLDFLAGLPADEARRYLLSLPGVGPKTAACVQVFALGQPALPVDTHVHRVAIRLGLVPPKATAEKTQRLLEEGTRAEDRLPLHLLLIQHGRRICRSANPRCGECVLRAECRMGRRKDGGHVSEE